MKITNRVFYYLTLCLNILLVFLSTFSDKLILPEWVSLTGRLHPVLLHFPLAVMLVSVGLFWGRKILGIQDGPIFRILFSISAFTAAITGLFGLFLSKEGGYDTTVLQQHQWLGVAISLLNYFIYLIFCHQLNTKWVHSLGVLSVVTVIWGSHLGGTLTHGDDFLSLKAKEETTEPIVTDTSVVYASLIEPILRSKCFTCHNENKSKGDLIMSSIELLLKGGKNGELWIPGDPLNSHILQRLDLPEEDKKHMPPKGKTQVTEEERTLIEEWIRNGADLKKRIMDYPAQDSFRIFLTNYIKTPATFVTYNFPAASAADLKSAQSPYCYVSPIATGSPALQVRFLIRSEFKPDHLKKLEKIADNIVQMNLSNMKMSDEDLKLLNAFQHLEILNLNGTDITGKGLNDLQSNKNLTSIALSNTKVDWNGFKQLITGLPTLKHLYCWNTVIDSSKLVQLKSINPALTIHLGYEPDEKEILQLTTAQLTDNENFVLRPGDSVRFKHPMPGVTIKYTLDGSGPDSIQSPSYSVPLIFSKATRVRTISVRKGWLTSDTTDHTFFVRSKNKPTYKKLLLQPDPKYAAQKELTLFDDKKGDPNNFREAFIGVRENHFEMMCAYNTPTYVDEILISTLLNTGAYVMPPEKLELWAGTDSLHMKKITQLIPVQPYKHESNKIQLQRLTVKGSYRYFKVKVFNLRSLPTWHDGKGQKGWLFMDEIFFN